VKFLLDENLSTQQSIVLREKGYDATAVADVGLSGQPDEIVGAFAIQSGRVLITLDGDFRPQRHIAFRTSCGFS
jgi:predicted nuclease of predicted toxin-antitoxin system